MSYPVGNYKIIMLVDELQKDKCCGCWACVNICPKHCISMHMDEEFFNYPAIDHHSCIGCGLCMKVCPSQMGKKFDIQTCKSYAAVNNSDIVRHNSSSGGAFHEIACQFFSENGVVYGAAFTSEWRVAHIKVDNLSELYRIQKSKYLQSSLNDIYNQIKTDLRNGQKVLFSGTPCQVMGLKNLPWAKNDGNLICVDIACHAVPSEKSWEYYLSSLGVDKSDITNLDFRDNAFPWHNYTLTIHTKDGVSFSEPCDKNPFMLGFIYNLTDRPSCHNCPAKGLQSGSDLMLADFWGVEKILPDMDDNKGTSLIIVKTESGNEILNRIASKFKIVSVSNDAFMNRGSTFLFSSAPHYKRNYFFRNLGTKNYAELINFCLKHNASLLDRIKRRLGFFSK